MIAAYNTSPSLVVSYLVNLAIVKNRTDIWYQQDSLLQLDLAGDIQRTIPIHGEQSLVIAHLNDKQHSFLFNDRILEVFDLDSKTKYQVYLNLGPVKKAHSLARYGSLYALNFESNGLTSK